MSAFRASSQLKIRIENGTPDIPICQKSSGLPPKIVSTPGTRIRITARADSKIIPLIMVELTAEVVNDDFLLLQAKILLH